MLKETEEALSVSPALVALSGLLLALLGGVPVTYSQAQEGPWGVGGGLQRRGTIHVLLLGDAGVGKSRLLQAAAAAANSSSSSNARGNMRSVLVCGNTASAAGLTAAAVREAGTGELIIEAGPSVPPGHLLSFSPILLFLPLAPPLHLSFSFVCLSVAHPTSLPAIMGVDP